MTPELQINSRLNVCMIAPSFYPIVGGMETQIERLIPFLRQHGVDAWVLTRRTPNTTAHEQRAGTDIYRARIAGGPAARSLTFTATGLARLLLNRSRVDLIHAHGIMSPTTVANMAASLLRVPKVVTLHARYELDHLLSKPGGAARLRRYRRSIDRFVSISDDISQLLTEHGVPSDRITSIPNGIDTRTYAPVSAEEQITLRLRLGLPVDVPVVVFVGRLHPVKQVDVLLRAWARVTNGLLVILGDGDERQRLDRLTQELGLGARVSFNGMTADVPSYLKAASAFVLPSASEGLSVALLEAMSSGAVPVASAVGGALDLIDHGSNGLLVPPGDVDALARELERVCLDDQWLANTSALARATVVETYDLNEIAHRLAQLYRSLAAAR